MRALVLAVALLAAAYPAQAATIVLDFEEEPLGSRMEFVSVECDCALLHSLDPGLDDNDSWLDIIDFPGLTNGRAIKVGDEGGGDGLVVELLVPVLAVSLDFGGDSPEFDRDEGPASLTAYDAADNVLAQAFVTPTGTTS